MFFGETEMLTGLEPVFITVISRGVIIINPEKMSGRKNCWVFFKPHHSEKLLIALLQNPLMTVPVTASGTATASLEHATAFWVSKDPTVGEVS